MITRSIHEYMSRDWAGVRDAKDRYWADRIGRLGAEEGLRIAEELRLQAIRSDPSWPGAEERRDDLAAHARVAELLSRVPYPRNR